QDEPSSVVWGMPGAAWKLDAAGEMQSIEHMAARLLALARHPHTGAGGA
ncbi:chemotaxis-specific methylesterase, partial [Rhodanobacter denitrificans]